MRGAAHRTPPPQLNPRCVPARINRTGDCPPVSTGAPPGPLSPQARGEGPPRHLPTHILPMMRQPAMEACTTGMVPNSSPSKTLQGESAVRVRPRGSPRRRRPGRALGAPSPVEVLGAADSHEAVGVGELGEAAQLVVVLEAGADGHGRGRDWRPALQPLADARGGGTSASGGGGRKARGRAARAGTVGRWPRPQLPSCGGPRPPPCRPVRGCTTAG